MRQLLSSNDEPISTSSNYTTPTVLSHSAAKIDGSKSAVVKLSMAQKPPKTEDWLGEQP
jgi:hypothetical protein